MSQSQTEQPIDLSIAMNTLINAIHSDRDYAWSWQCAVAMSMVDSGVSHEKANIGAARFLSMLTMVAPSEEIPEGRPGVDITLFPEFQAFIPQWEQERSVEETDGDTTQHEEIDIHYNYRMTAMINNTAGNKADPENIEGLLKQLTLIEHEVEEGLSHINDLKTNSDALRDDVCDILFTGYGLAHRMGLSVDQVMLNAEQTNYTQVKEGVVRFINDNDGYVGLNTLRDQHLAIIGVLDGIRNIISEVGVTPDVHSYVKLILCKAYEIGVFCGYPVSDDYIEVVESNISKFDKSIENAYLTQEKYLDLAVVTNVTETTLEYTDRREVVYVTRSAVDQIGNDGAKYPEGKWLKSIDFKEPAYVTPRLESYLQIEQ